MCATRDYCVGRGTVGVCSSMISSLVNPENDRIKILGKDYLVEMGMVAHKALNKCEYELRLLTSTTLDKEVRLDLVDLVRDLEWLNRTDFESIGIHRDGCRGLNGYAYEDAYYEKSMTEIGMVQDKMILILRKLS